MVRPLGPLGFVRSVRRLNGSPLGHNCRSRGVLSGTWRAFVQQFHNSDATFFGNFTYVTCALADVTFAEQRVEANVGPPLFFNHGGESGEAFGFAVYVSSNELWVHRAGQRAA